MINPSSKLSLQHVYQRKHANRPESSSSAPVENSMELVTLSTNEPKVWDFYLPSHETYFPKIAYDANLNIIDDLKSNLTPTQLQLFRETCFGYFLEMPKQTKQTRFVQYLMNRQVHHESPDVLWFDLNGCQLRFGLGEFALVTGLKCTGVQELVYREDNNLLRMYFNGSANVTRQEITHRFEMKCWGNSDTDAVKIAVLHFLSSFLFLPLKTACLARCYVDLVDSGNFNDYPWGIDVFKVTRDSLHKKLLDVPTFARHAGLTHAFQIWFCECCPLIGGKVATRVGTKVPCMLNWEGKKRLAANSSELDVFYLPVETLKPSNITPSDAEWAELELDGLEFGIPNQYQDSRFTVIDHTKNKQADIGTCQIQQGLNEDFAATAKASKAARTFAASTSVPSETRAVDTNENLAEFKKVVDSGFQSLQAYVDTKFIEGKKEFDDFKEQINSKLNELLNAIALVADKRVPEHTDGNKGDQADVMENDGSTGRLNSDPTKFEQNSHEHAAFVGLSSPNVTAVVDNQTLEDADINHELFHSTVSGTSEGRITELFDGMKNPIALVADKCVPEYTDGNKGDQADVMENDGTTGRLNSDLIKFEQNSREHEAFVGLSSPNVTAIVDNQTLEDAEINHELFRSTVSGTTEGRITELSDGMKNPIALVADNRVPEYTDGNKGDQANVMENDGSTGRLNSDPIRFEQNSPEEGAFVCLSSLNVTAAVDDQILADGDINHEPFRPTVSATTEVSDGRITELSDGMENDGDAGRKERNDITFEENSVELATLVGVSSVNATADAEFSHEVKITAAHPNALVGEIACETTVHIENKISDADQEHQLEISDSKLNELVDGIARQATYDVEDKPSAQGLELESSGSESYTRIALIALPATYSKLPSKDDCKDYNAKSHDDDVFEKDDNDVATAVKRRSIEKTPVVRKRCRRTAAVKESPYVSTWNSGASVISISEGNVNAASSPKKVVSKKFPFIGSITQIVDFNLECEFNNFVKKKKGETEKLDKVFEFEVGEISSKSWFRSLYTPRKDLNSLHLDVIFYYLRKKAKYALKVKMTTTDYNFHKILTQAYEDLTGNGENKFNIDKYDDVIDYMLGFTMFCNTPWYDVDEVLCPVHDLTGWHWILARISLVDRCIYVYDSLGDPSGEISVKKSLQPYSVLLPLFLLTINFYEKRDDIEIQGGRHKGRDLADPYTIEYIRNLPTQDGIDCGAFVASFAEYIIEGVEIPKFDVHSCRARFAVLLWKYGKDKQERKEQSDSEDPGRNPERQGKHRRGKKRKK